MSKQTSKRQAYPAKIKERVDFIYTLTTEQADGYRGGFSSFDNLMGDVVRELVRRGIVAKVHDENKERRNYIYKWVASMAPTKALYGNIVSALREKSREKKREAVKRSKEREKEKAVEAIEETASAEAAPVIDNPIPAPANEEKIARPLEAFSDKEIWGEMKLRGYTIEDNRLVIIRKEFLE